ncbi:hypothetical protein O3G_MSEX001260 [Manduca sexta]|uniref:Reverse transcriptase domain-containing protein n=1 Tax=Manduca sexta TaxID=7130 RepID=A0A921YJM7_MANSE|nr:hypothetical protein O3G_MSEX001260 [Manduca sexta]
MTRLNDTFFLNPTTPEEVSKIILSLKNTTSTGIDNLSTNIIKKVHSIICYPLSFIINLCFEEGVFPKPLKLSIVKPIFKNGDETSLNNYRPVALIPIFAKIIEKAIHSRLYNFLENKNILVEEQKGFRRSKSINAAIFDFLKNTMNSIDNRIPICALYMDMTKAFDYVDHEILIHKLERYGIRGKGLELLSSYLSDRHQCTKTTNINIYNKLETKYRSKFRNIKYGVPQGSVLGPLLFLVYINDLPNNINHPTVLFADDSTIVIKYDKNYKYEDEINNTLEQSIEWLEQNNLRINLEKTQFMQFSQRQITQQLNIKYNRVTINETNATKFLGLIIDSKLNWKQQIQAVCKKINCSAYALYKLSKVVNRDAVLTAYHGYVESILRYGIIFWGNSTDKNDVFVSQKKCIRAICNLPPRESCEPYFKSLKLLTFPSLYIYEVAVFIKTHGHLFEMRPPTDTRLRTREANSLSIGRSNTALLQKSIYRMGPAIYNKLSPTIKDVEQINLFKSKFKNFLINKCFYSIDDFFKS